MIIIDETQYSTVQYSTVQYSKVITVRTWI